MINPCINRHASAQFSLLGGENIRGNFNTDYLPGRIFSPVIFIYISNYQICCGFLKWATAAGELGTSSVYQKITDSVLSCSALSIVPLLSIYTRLLQDCLEKITFSGS